MIFIQNFLQESAYDVTIEDLFNATVKLEEKEKVYSNAEGEVIKYQISNIKYQISNI